MRRPSIITCVMVLLLTLLAGAFTMGPAGAWDRPVRADDGARVVAERRLGPREMDLTIQSPALGSIAQVRLLTPDGWSPGRHAWPVLWLLHGCCGGYADWTTYSDVAQLPALRQVLVVMPEAGAAGWYSDWWNYGRGGAPRWEEFHLGEVRQIVERGYGAGERRVAAGLSMGGFGALLYAARHPGFFRAVASYSGTVHPLLQVPGGFGPDWFLDLDRGAGVDPYAIWGDPAEQRAVWAAHDPTLRAGPLRGLPVFLSCGDGRAGPYDPPGTTDPGETYLERQNQALAARLRALGSPAVTDFYGPGHHDWPYWQRELRRSLPMLLAALRA
ncbi:Diacylglycerol acyltransferase/mycolyltransferase Ag85B [Streptomyces hundungensis]|uniref:Diacylglycerol acyltransferase/mycolyltransferase Ag85B n=1 Tax=Streptomyces hundungensis TaxID=1077946 RepID=A0A387HM00_9ACTN|nr:alpha/beta hydrolase family protein [Streptomyces hundungensis]AYG84574.1 Diacylglycerol acyltransferase/mycolyltransferase Ag85B [Streptomyces hundungensis]